MLERQGKRKTPAECRGRGRNMETFYVILLQSVLLIFINVTVAGYLTIKMAVFLWEKINELKADRFK